MSVLNRASYLIISLASLGAGLLSALAHPVAPVLCSVAFFGSLTLFLWRPGFGLYSLPVLLPLLNFSPWTGWLIVDEFDLLVLAVVAAGYFRMQMDGVKLHYGSVFLLLLSIVALLVVRGANDLAMQELNWFSGYTTPLNAFRVGKSLLWAVLLFPLIVQAGKASLPDKSKEGFFCACLLGSLWVVLAVFWERAFYPGLLNISTPYRTVALFWEMHLGGAALDAYLVLIAPLLVWAWRTTVSQPRRIVLGVFILAFVYVCLTTFSRGVFGAIAGSVILLGALLAWRRVKGGPAPQRVSPTSIIILVFVALEILLLLSADSFMSKRLAASERDFGQRMQHWERGIGLLKTPDDWLFGIGLGKLPTRLTQGEAGLAVSGTSFWHQDTGRRSMVITGPSGATNAQELGGLYALSQRVDLISGQRYRFAMDVHSEQDLQMLIQVCAQHLLYPARCQYRTMRVKSGEWERLETSLSGYPFKTRFWQSVGHGIFFLSVLTPGTKVEVANLNLSVSTGNLLHNARFLEEGAGWFPAASSYFLPWHIDNLYLEILIETGLIGLFLSLAVVFLVEWRLFLAYGQGNALAPYFMSCVAGLMALGLVVSVLDMPRVATLFGIFLIWAWRSSGSGPCEKGGGWGSDKVGLSPEARR